jgi:hypothetical protein
MVQTQGSRDPCIHSLSVRKAIKYVGEGSSIIWIWIDVGPAMKVAELESNQSATAVIILRNFQIVPQLRIRQANVTVTSLHQ